MKNLNVILAILLVLSLACVLLMYMIGMQSYSEQLDAKLMAHSEQVRQENDQLAQRYEVALDNALKQQQIESDAKADAKHEELRVHMRELLLNSGISLEELNSSPEPEEPSMTIAQEIYESLYKGQSYKEVIEVLGREGENILTMEDAAGRTSSYEWKWGNSTQGTDTMSITFINGRLSHKTYSAFEF